MCTFKHKLSLGLNDKHFIQNTNRTWNRFIQDVYLGLINTDHLFFVVPKINNKTNLVQSQFINTARAKVFYNVNIQMY